MVFVSSNKEYPSALLVLFFVSSGLFLNGTQGLQNRQNNPAKKLPVINHKFCQSCPREVSSLKSDDTYSVLKNDRRASLPSSFTICISVLVTTDNVWGISLFTLLGNDGQAWFSPQFGTATGFVDGRGQELRYRVKNLFVENTTAWMFPQQWVRSCLALNTVSGLVQCVSRGELLDNRTLSGITTNVPTDLSDKLILGSYYWRTINGKWRIARENSYGIYAASVRFTKSGISYTVEATGEGI